MPRPDRRPTRAIEWRGHAHHQQPELRLLVAARLAALQDRRPGIRRGDGRGGRSLDAGRAAAAVALVPGAVPDPRRRSRSGTPWRSPNTSTRCYPEAGLLPADRADRARCRSMCGEMHSGFANLRSALPMNLKGAPSRLQGLGRRPGRHRPHRAIWRECLAASGGPFLFGEPCHGRRHVRAGLHPLPHLRRGARQRLRRLCATIMAMPYMREWVAAALTEPDEVEELDVEF